MDVVSHTVINLIIFVLAIYVGYHVVWTVTPALHTPLMAVTNAISAIVIVGAMLAAALTETPLGKTDGRARGRARRGQRLRRLPGDAANARDVQEEGQAEGGRGAGGREEVSLNLVTLLYLVASICFIQALKGLSHPTTSIRGNLFGMVGMAIAAFTTAALIVKLLESYQLSVPVGLGWILLGLVVGGGYGAWRAKTVQMTQMPELVAFFHSMIGMAAVFIAVAAAVEPYAFGIVARPVAGGAVDPIPTGNRLELILGAAIGAITFSGSVIAWGKLSAKSKIRVFQGAPVTFPGQHWLNLALGDRDDRLHRRLHADREPVRLLPRAGDRLPARRADHHPDRRRRHAGRRLDAQQLLGLGRGRHRLLAQQRDADHRRLAGRQLGRDPELHHVQGDEPLVLQRHPRRLRRRGRAGGRRQGRAAAGQERQRRRRRVRPRQRRDGRHRSRLRPGGRARAARGQGARDQADREGRRRSSTRSIRSPAACRAT